MTDEARTAQADLRRYKDAKRDIRDMADKINALQARINSTTSRLKEISIQSSSQQSKEELICILADLRDEYCRQQCEAEKVMYEIELKISEIGNGLYRRILRNYYLYNQTFEQIAVSESLCYDYITNSHRRALDRYYRVLQRHVDKCSFQTVINNP